ncbi:MAG: hypothetical protein ACI9H8_002468 [Lysobacterales bacterium]|jgi:hypothetical protein
MSQIFVSLQRKQIVGRKGKNLRFFLFGILAVALHLSLLMIPFRQPKPPEPPKVIKLEIVVIPPVMRQPPLQDTSTEPLEILREASVISESNEPPQPPEAPIQQINTPARVVITTNELIEQFEHTDLLNAEPEVLTLGVANYRPLPANLAEPVLAYNPTVFEKHFAPIETETLDEWKLPDGTMMVVMRTITGHTLCGRQAPWDPSNPHLEPVQMFYKCSGGGRRKR